MKETLFAVTTATPAESGPPVVITQARGRTRESAELLVLRLMSLGFPFGQIGVTPEGV